MHRFLYYFFLSKQHVGGVILEGDKIENYLTVEKDFLMHKQIELRNGILYMRMKKRILKAEN